MQDQFWTATAVCRGDNEVRDGLEKEKRQDMKWLKAFDFVHNVKMKKFPDQNVVEKSWVGCPNNLFITKSLLKYVLILGKHFTFLGEFHHL